MSRRAASNADYPTFPGLKADIGEDPARFLHVSDPDLAYARIKMLESVTLCNAWEAVERKAFGGRSEYLLRIRKRREELQAEAAADSTPTDDSAAPTTAASDDTETTTDD